MNFQQIQNGMGEEARRFRSSPTCAPRGTFAFNVGVEQIAPFVSQETLSELMWMVLFLFACWGPGKAQRTQTNGLLSHDVTHQGLASFLNLLQSFVVQR